MEFKEQGPKIKALKELAKAMAKLELDKISGYKKEPKAAEEESEEAEPAEDDEGFKKVLEARAKKLV